MKTIVVKGPWCPINDPLPEGITAPVDVIVLDESEWQKHRPPGEQMELELNL